MKIGPRVGTSGGVGTCADADLTVSRLRLEIAIIRIMNAAKLLLVLSMVTFGTDFHYKASRIRLLTKFRQIFFTNLRIRLRCCLIKQCFFCICFSINIVLFLENCY
jgi:hypothetical protein